MKKDQDSFKQAVAIAYAGGFQAPKVVASGKGIIAENIIKAAQDNGVYVHESKELVAMLMDVKLDQEIPAELYRVVAELLGWLYKIEKANPPKDLPTLP